MKSVNAQFSVSNGTNETSSSHMPKKSNMSKKSFKRSISSPAKKAKIPRPPNSFILYRRDNAAKFPGMVATKLSAQMAFLWKHETKEQKQYYANEARLAVEDHKRRFPHYKFTPAPRGTGKLALKAAAAKAAKENASSLPVQAGRLRQSSKTGSNKSLVNIAPKKRTSRPFEHSALATPSPSPSVSSSPSPPPEAERTTPANRPKRNTQRPDRFSPCGYRERLSHSGQAKSSSSPEPEPECSDSSSLFFSSHSDRLSSRAPKTLKSSVSSRSLTCTMSSKPRQQYCERSSDTCVDFKSLGFSDASLYSGEDDEGGDNWNDGDYGDKRMPLSPSDIKQEPFSQSEAKTLDRPISSLFQPQESFISNTTYPFPYTMENYEPGCLPRSASQWAASALVSSFGAHLAGPHIHSSPMLFSEYMYPTPGLEEPIIDFAEYTNFDDQDNADVKVEAKADGSFEFGCWTLNLAVNTIAASAAAAAAAASGSPFPMDSMIPLSLLSPTSATTRAMENMSLSSAATKSDKDDKTSTSKVIECL